MVQEALDIIEDDKPLDQRSAAVKSRLADGNNELLELPPLPKAALDTVKNTIENSISKV